jgi:hypothetical protein
MSTQSRDAVRCQGGGRGECAPVHYEQTVSPAWSPLKRTMLNSVRTAPGLTAVTRMLVSTRSQGLPHTYIATS